MCLCLFTFFLSFCLSFYIINKKKIWKKKEKKKKNDPSAWVRLKISAVLFVFRSAQVNVYCQSHFSTLIFPSCSYLRMQLHFFFSFKSELKTVTPPSFRVLGQTDYDSFPSVKKKKKKSFELHLPHRRYFLFFHFFFFENPL